MDTPVLVRPRGWRWPGMPHVLMLLGLALCLFGCDPGGEQGRLSSSDGPNAPAEQQVIQRLLGLYQEALVEEDIDRLHALLAPATGQATPVARTDLPTRVDALAFTPDGRLVVAGRDRNLYA